MRDIYTPSIQTFTGTHRDTHALRTTNMHANAHSDTDTKDKYVHKCRRKHTLNKDTEKTHITTYKHLQHICTHTQTHKYKHTTQVHPHVHMQACVS